MKKPHEQEWRQEWFRYVERRDTTETVAEIPLSGPDEMVALVRFIAAAPDMARAPDGELHDGTCGAWIGGRPCNKPCMVKRAALAKAGVL